MCNYSIKLKRISKNSFLGGNNTGIKLKIQTMKKFTKEYKVKIESWGFAP